MEEAMEAAAAAVADLAARIAARSGCPVECCLTAAAVAYSSLATTELWG